MVYGSAGLGKTKISLYLSTQYDAVYVRATNSMSPKRMFEEIAKELDEIPRFYTSDILVQIADTIGTLEKAAQANGFNQIGENIVWQVSGG